MFHCREHKQRIAIPEKKLCDDFKRWIAGKRSSSATKSLLSLLKINHRSIANVFKWANDSFGNSIPVAIVDIFSCLASESPVCSYFYPSLEVKNLSMKLFDIHLKSNSAVMKQIQHLMPLFFNVLSSLQIENCLLGEWKGLIIDLADLAIFPFTSAETINTQRIDSSDEICRLVGTDITRFTTVTKITKGGKGGKDLCGYHKTRYLKRIRVFWIFTYFQVPNRRRV